MTPRDHAVFAALWLLCAVALLVTVGIGHSFARVLVAGAVLLAGYASWELWLARRGR